MTPTIALIGRPNVGKSTLFNALTGSRDALVADCPGVTRDRRYGAVTSQAIEWNLIDTGGLFGADQDDMARAISQQSLLAIDEAQVIYFLVDVKEGITPGDLAITERLRHVADHVVVVVNKVDHNALADEAVAFHQFGFAHLCSISASHRQGLLTLMRLATSCIDETAYRQAIQQQTAACQGTCVAVVGRPNVGKSTLVNRLLGEDRMVALDFPGTTRDSIFSRYQTRDGRDYTLVDTAGVRKKARVSAALEKFSIVKTLQAIRLSHVCLLLIDASEDLVEQDLHCISMVVDAGKGLVLVINKWDGLSDDKKQHVRQQLDRRLSFVSYAPRLFISAKHGSGVGVLMDQVDKVYHACTLPLATSQLTQLLAKAIGNHVPPMIAGRRIKLRYAHSGGHNPPTIVIHGNQTDRLSETYRRYLSNFFRDALGIIGTPIRLVFKTSDNPYQGRKNKLTLAQQRKRKRLLKHVKK